MKQTKSKSQVTENKTRCKSEDLIVPDIPNKPSACDASTPTLKEKWIDNKGNIKTPQRVVYEEQMKIIQKQDELIASKDKEIENLQEDRKQLFKELSQARQQTAQRIFKELEKECVVLDETDEYKMIKLKYLGVLK